MLFRTNEKSQDEFNKKNIAKLLFCSRLEGCSPQIVFQLLLSFYAEFLM